MNVNRKSGEGLTEVRQSQVGKQFESMGAAVEMLEKSVELLFDRLSPVLRNIPVSPETEKQPEREILVPFADGLRAFREKIEAQTIRIQALRDNCEL